MTNELAQFYRLGVEAARLMAHEPLALRAGALVRDERAGLSGMAFLLGLSWEVTATTPFDLQAFRRQLAGCSDDCRTSFEIGCLVGLLQDVQDGGVTSTASKASVVEAAEHLGALLRSTALTTTVERELGSFLYHVGTPRGAAALEILETEIDSRLNALTTLTLVPLVFISHSSQDRELVTTLGSLLTGAITGLVVSAIRCTSDERTAYDPGVTVEMALRSEAVNSPLLLAIITPQSVQSPWVLFELGARWGANRTSFPLLARGATPQHLPGPLRSLNAVDLASTASVDRLVEKVAAELHLALQPHSRFASMVACVAREATRACA